MIALHHAATPNSQRARIALEESGLRYDLHPVDLWTGEQNGEAFLALNPLGAVPVLVDTDGPDGVRTVLTQSIAILIYIGEKSGRLVPPDKMNRLAMMQWLAFSASDIAGTNTAINQLRRSAPEQSVANTAFFEARLTKYFVACDRRLSQCRFLAKEFSLADIALYPFAHARRVLIEGAGLSHVQRWADDVGRRPAVQRAMKD
jgi:GSH-dependent disulfide-bond oxidoreductase